MQAINLAELLRQYLLMEGKADISPDDLTDETIGGCLLHYKKSVPWGNRQYNNILGYLSIMFNYLKKRKKVKHNPCEEVDKLGI